MIMFRSPRLPYSFGKGKIVPFLLYQLPSNPAHCRNRVFFFATAPSIRTDPPPTAEPSSSLYDQSQQNIQRIIHQTSSHSSPSIPYIFGICIDGSDPSYHEPTIATTVTPSIELLMITKCIAEGALPSFTNPNNVSLITATSPREHGISGNYAFMPIDGTEGSSLSSSASASSPSGTSTSVQVPVRRKEVSMVSSSMIRSPSILAEAYRAGFDVIIITAKDKLLNLLSHQLPVNDTVPPFDASAAGVPTPLGVHSEASNNVSVSSPDQHSTSTDQPFLIRLSLEALSYHLQQKPFTSSNPVSPETIAFVTSVLGRSSSSSESSSESSSLSDAPSNALSYLSPSTFPGIYDPLISVGVIDIGNILARYIYSLRAKNTKQKSRPLLAYLSTTDYVQHKYAPGSKEANLFYRSLDRAIGGIGKWDNFSSFPSHPSSSSSPSIYLGFTADHGMNYKCHTTNGEPHILYIEELLDITYGIPNTTILPITDAHVIHHGALGGYCTVYLQNPHDTLRAQTILRSIPGIDFVFTRDEAAQVCELPPDRIGDLVIMSDKDTVVGKRKSSHTLHFHQIQYLRSHGSHYEQKVPLYFNKDVTVKYRSSSNNSDIGHKGDDKVKNRLRSWYLLPILLSMATKNREFLV